MSGGITSRSCGGITIRSQVVLVVIGIGPTSHIQAMKLSVVVLADVR